MVQRLQEDMETAWPYPCSSVHVCRAGAMGCSAAPPSEDTNAENPTTFWV